MTRARRRAPLRQPRGPRATIPDLPRPELPSGLDIHIWGTACETCQQRNNECTCKETQK